MNCVLWLAGLKSYKRCKFNQAYPNKTVPIQIWNKRLKERDSVLRQHGPPHRVMSKYNVEGIRKASQRSPRKTFRRIGSPLGLPRSAVHDFFTRKILESHACQVQLVRKITSKDHYSRKLFVLEMLSRTEEDETYLDRLCFLDDAPRHVCGRMDRPNCHG
jgi:hypothetical protein